MTWGPCYNKDSSTGGQGQGLDSTCVIRSQMMPVQLVQGPQIAKLKGFFLQNEGAGKCLRGLSAS